MSVVVRWMEGAEFGIPSFVLVVGTTTFYRREIITFDKDSENGGHKVMGIGEEKAYFSVPKKLPH